MPQFYSTEQPIAIVPANPNRTALKICNLSDTTAYIAKFGEAEKFDERAWPIKLEGIFELEDEGYGCYKGPVFAIVSAQSDIRIWES